MRAHWNWNKVLFVAAVLAAAAAGGFLAVRTTGRAVGDEKIGQAPTAKDPATTEDETALRKIQAAYVKAFNTGDAKALAAFWAPDGEFVDAEGKSYRGRSAIEKEFTDFFAKEKGMALEITSDTLRFVSPTVALESGTARVTRLADGASNMAAYTIVHTKRDGLWLMASVRETPYAAASNYERLRDLEWLVGSWKSEHAGQTLELECEWTAKRNFLTRKFTLKAAGGTTKTGLQIIGWDPVAGKIRSWVFDSDGGFGSEWWTRDGKRWVLEAAAVTRDGTSAASVNVLTILDHDNFNWQSVQRDLNQVRLPDTALIKVTRVKAKK
jgi:uncharacterized protein (TIGR02246 family)